MKTIVFTEIDQIAFLKLNRPDVRNAFNSGMIEELTQIFIALQSRSDLKAVGLSGEGKVFCAGADLNWMKSMVDFSLAENKQDSLKLYEMFAAMKNLDLPIVAAVHGAVFGGALGLVACCDYVVAEIGTKFCFSEVKLGIAPAVISGFVLDKANSAVKYYMTSAEVFSENQALALGLVNFSGAKDDVTKEFQRVLHLYKENGPVAVRRTKQLLRHLSGLNLAQHQETTTGLIAELRVSQEGQEGIKSFLENRKPSWKV
ncbi:MAG: enoyl-CoA hydratase/isomerase family protein [Bdellovibrionaceae bacterium]|nr:enoyl-CoA hydratase/isomerase family protein [Pseudobdellovibrionaceae bacterium]